ncbi:glycosyltransferase family protein [Thiorhodovibrio frisius]|uniref:glycosyltransferase family protein n=1 Tax=Thiorhodovibrio frisius TaxID=631362 RepID=UPI00022C72CD|nr:glycosyltransferase [Thiorhodovibrio frisius]WPL24632.1 Spore protein YkvP [Thiorhodovibrio frisius]
MIAAWPDFTSRPWRSSPQWGWDHHPTLHRRHRGFPEQDELVSIYHQARIVVNTSFSADGEGRPQTKLRHFEVAGCGAFQLVNDNPELRELFEPDREMVFYRDMAELEAKLRYYLEHDEEREAIAAAERLTDRHHG